MTRALPVLAAATACAFAQPRAFTAADYEHAEKFMGYSTTPLVLRSGVRPAWIEGDKFWYRVTTEKGTGIPADRSGERHASARLRSRESRRGAVGGVGQGLRGVEAAVYGDRVREQSSGDPFHRR
jgi:hypothetical protein